MQNKKVCSKEQTFLFYGHIIFTSIIRQITTKAEHENIPNDITFLLPALTCGISFAFLKPLTTGLYNIRVNAAFNEPFIKLNGKIVGNNIGITASRG